MPAPTVIVEDGTGVAGANSYISVEYANSYHEAGLYATAWTVDADPDKKARAVILATRMIDAGMKFKGIKGNGNNALEWPRLYADNPESPGVAYWAGYGNVYGNWYGSTEIPDKLKKATAELAAEVLKKDRSAEWSALGISSVGLGQGAVDVSFTGDAPDLVQPFTPMVADLLSPLGFPRSAGSTATVRRG